MKNNLKNIISLATGIVFIVCIFSPVYYGKEYHIHTEDDQVIFYKDEPGKFIIEFWKTILCKKNNLCKETHSNNHLI